mgnify:CR=1 FL=1
MLAKPARYVPHIYTDSELVTIVNRSASLLGIELDAAGASEIATRSHRDLRPVSEREAPDGQRVMDHHYSGCGVCPHCRVGWSQLCVEGIVVYGVTGHGAHAPWMKVPASTLVPLPDELSFETGERLVVHLRHQRHQRRRRPVEPHQRPPRARLTRKAAGAHQSHHEKRRNDRVDREL